MGTFDVLLFVLILEDYLLFGGFSWVMTG